MTARLAAVVLAAGASSRLGSPKQLVLHQGVPLVTRAAGVALKLGADPVVVVLGANAEIDTWTDADAGSCEGGVHTTIAAAEYADTVGVPAVFGRAHFDALCSLPPAAGTVRLLHRADMRVSRMALPEAAVDIDTPEHLEQLLP